MQHFAGYVETSGIEVIKLKVYTAAVLPTLVYGPVQRNGAFEHAIKFTASCTCGKSHPGICSPLINSVVSNLPVSGQSRPWSLWTFRFCSVCKGNATRWFCNSVLNFRALIFSALYINTCTYLPNFLSTAYIIFYFIGRHIYEKYTKENISRALRSGFEWRKAMFLRFVLP